MPLQLFRAIKPINHFLRLCTATFQIDIAIGAAAARYANVEAFASADRVITRIGQRVAVLQSLFSIARRGFMQQLQRLGSANAAI